MAVQEGRQFKRSFFGYNRTAVDAEFSRLISQTNMLTSEKENLSSQVNVLSSERDSLSRERNSLSNSVAAMTGQVMELESNLLHARSENDSLARSVEAHKAENNALQLRFDQLRIRDRDFALREREFTELQNSVSSIMSVTKRATDRLFQKAVDNQERITQIAGDAAREVAGIRADMADVREMLNKTLDELQDRIDRVDASLTGAVHKLVAIKHDDGLQIGENRPDVLSEVERLLSMRAGEVDFAGGKGYTVPVLGPYGAKFMSDTAQRVTDGRISAPDDRGETAVHQGNIDVKKANPTPFDSTEESILEANNLLERGGMTSEEYYQSYQPQPEPPQVIEMPAPIQIGFAPQVEDAGSVQAGGSAMYIGDNAQQGGAQTYGQSYFFQSVEEPEQTAPAEAEPEIEQPEVIMPTRVTAVKYGTPKKVSVRARKR
ncbi:MAG: hypothetical protein E7546_00160 [Ruminococcaceae bacterium]|nr:hypothetical protein [Oscillospiraceae bacterium]